MSTIAFQPPTLRHWRSAGIPEGQLEQGNINLRKRPIVHNPDGSYSTVRSISFQDDGREVLIPTIRHGLNRSMSPDEAIEHYRNTGEHLGVFDSAKNASSYAQQLHREQHKLYGDPQPPAPSIAPQPSSNTATTERSPSETMMGQWWSKRNPAAIAQAWRDWKPSISPETQAMVDQAAAPYQAYADAAGGEHWRRPQLEEPAMYAAPIGPRMPTQQEVYDRANELLQAQKVDVGSPKRADGSASDWEAWKAEQIANREAALRGEEPKPTQPWQGPSGKTMPPSLLRRGTDGKPIGGYLPPGTQGNVPAATSTWGNLTPDQQQRISAAAAQRNPSLRPMAERQRMLTARARGERMTAEMAHLLENPGEQSTAAQYAAAGVNPSLSPQVLENQRQARQDVLDNQIAVAQIEADGRSDGKRAALTQARNEQRLNALFQFRNSKEWQEATPDMRRVKEDNFLRDYDLHNPDPNAPTPSLQPTPPAPAASASNAPSIENAATTAARLEIGTKPDGSKTWMNAEQYGVQPGATAWTLGEAMIERLRRGLPIQQNDLKQLRTYIQSRSEADPAFLDLLVSEWMPGGNKQPPAEIIRKIAKGEDPKAVWKQWRKESLQKTWEHPVTQAGLKILLSLLKK